jgi:hypothetical protein
MKMRFSYFLLFSAALVAGVAWMLAPTLLAQDHAGSTAIGAPIPPKMQRQSAPSNSLLKVPQFPPAPRLEPIEISELPLPPTASSSAEGSCSAAINPKGTGCIASYDNGIFEGPAYMWDGKHVLMPVEFAGAAAGSIYSGQQVIAIRTDGTLFPNGDAWKCITCGVPAENALGASQEAGPGAGWIAGSSSMTARGGPTHIVVDHPQAFHDGRRMIAGSNVVDCGEYKLTDAGCTPERVHIYPMYWSMSADGSGASGNMREIRLNPDDVHLGWNSFVGHGTSMSELAAMGTLVFNPAPRMGPRVPRYDLEKVSLFVNSSPEFALFSPDQKKPGYLVRNSHGLIGEWRGWSSDGKSAIGIDFEESGNFDLFRTSLATGESVRITTDPGYTDPMKMSPDDKWFVCMDTRPYPERHMWYAGMQGIPPLTDMLSVPLSAFGWRNGNRRFFQPILLDAWGDRGNYHGQQLNAGPGTPGSPSDPNWNGRADPAWSPDGTRVVYWQALVTAPACGGVNPLPCPESTEPGGRRTRLMMAQLTSRKPLLVKAIEPVSDKVPWGFAHHPGDTLPAMWRIPAGKYILLGQVSGRADVEFRETPDKLAINAVSVSYKDFSDDRIHIINGTESVETVGRGITARLILRSNLKLSGIQTGSKVTNEDGFTPGIFGQKQQGTLTTTIDGKIYTPPTPGT